MKQEIFQPKSNPSFEWEKFEDSHITTDPTQKYLQDHDIPHYEPQRIVEPDWKKEYNSPDFILHEFERKLQYSENLIEYYTNKILTFKRVLEEIAPDDVISRTLLTEALENFAFSLQKIKKPIELYSLLQNTSDPVEISTIQQQIISFRFPTNVSGSTETLHTQVIAKTAYLSLEKRRLSGTDAHPGQLTPAERLKSLSNVLDLEIELADLTTEIHQRQNDIYTHTEPIVSIPSDHEMELLKSKSTGVITNKEPLSTPSGVPTNTQFVPAKTTVSAGTIPDFLPFEEVHFKPEKTSAEKPHSTPTVVPFGKRNFISTIIKKLTDKFKRAA